MIYCLHPHRVFNKYLGSYITVPCGTCSACTSLHANSWKTRLEMEAKVHRYVFFQTLTYTDESLPRLELDKIPFENRSETFEDSVARSKDFIRFHHGKIPYVRVSDFQKFMKRLRKNIYKKIGYHEKGLLRYFCAFEYGPTTFRPHMHMLLFFDSERVAGIIKECIYKSWRHQASNQEVSSFFRRNVGKFVDASCSGYVAGYLNCTSNLPAILREKQFRVKHVQSQNPPIGFAAIQPEQIQRILLGDSSTFSFVSEKTNRPVNLSLFTTLESRFFPRCLGYARLSPVDRRALYTLSTRYGKENSISFDDFFQRFKFEWNDSPSTASFLYRLFSYDSQARFSDVPVINENSVRRAYYLFKCSY